MGVMYDVALLYVIINFTAFASQSILAVFKTLFASHALNDINSGYFAYTGYASGQGAKYYNNTLHSTTSYTIYYHYGGTSSGEGVEYKNNSITLVEIS